MLYWFQYLEMLNIRILLMPALAIMLACAVGTRGQSTNTFRWIDPQRDAALWNTIGGAFRTQLDAPEPDYPQLNYGYIAQIAVADHAALVIVGHKAGKYPKPDWKGVDRFSAYNYNLVTRLTSKIADLQYVWFWKFIKLARFDSSPVPDLVFTYYDCWECESNEMLSAAHYDPALQQWQVRQWNTGGQADWTTKTGLIIEFASEPDDPLISYENLYGVVHLEGTGFDGVALRSRWISKRTPHHVDDWTLVYTVKNGVFVGKPVSDKQEQLKVWSKLCVNSRNKLCQGLTTAR